MTKQNEDVLANETGVEPSLSEVEVKQYLQEVLKEIRKGKTQNGDKQLLDLAGKTLATLMRPGATIYAADKVPTMDDKTYNNQAKPPFIRFLKSQMDDRHNKQTSNQKMYNTGTFHKMVTALI